MVSDLKLTLACGDYDLHEALKNGSVRPRGIDLTVVTMPSPERHWRLWRHHEFDVAESSMCMYLTVKGHRLHPYTAIPVFPHRRMRHGYLFVNSAAGIRTPKDLEGRRVGVRHWQTTAVHWARGILQDYYGVDLRSIQYYCQDEEPIAAVPPSPAFDVQRVPKGRNVDEMLCQGDLEAVIYPETLPSIHRGDPRVRRMFDDVKAEEVRFFRDTGYFPIMHTVVLRDKIIARHPWVPEALVAAFQQAKELAYQRLATAAMSIPWVELLYEEQLGIMGPDPWPNGLGAENLRHITAMMRWAVEHGLMPQPVPMAELFNLGKQ